MQSFQVPPAVVSSAGSPHQGRRHAYMGEPGSSGVAIPEQPDETAGAPALGPVRDRGLTKLRTQNRLGLFDEVAE